MKIGRYPNKLIFLLCLINTALFYLSITWRITENFDRVITDSLFYGAIFYLLWQRQSQIEFKRDLFSSFIGTILITVVIIKSLTLFSFEDKLICLIPFFSAISLALLASGFSGIGQYKQELFLTGFLFFPEAFMGMFLDKFVSVTIVNAKLASYFLHYIGFNVTSQGKQILLYLPDLGQFKTIVNYSCSGMPMIIFLLKLSLVIVCLFPFSKKQCLLIPIISVITGFILGVIRVCILTLLIPQAASFDYWHGSNGSQIFSTLAIIIFSGWVYWLIQKEGFLDRDNPII